MCTFLLMKGNVAKCTTTKKKQNTQSKYITQLLLKVDFANTSMRVQISLRNISTIPQYQLCGLNISVFVNQALRIQQLEGYLQKKINTQHIHKYEFLWFFNIKFFSLFFSLCSILRVKKLEIAGIFGHKLVPLHRG